MGNSIRQRRPHRPLFIFVAKVNVVGFKVGAAHGRVGVHQRPMSGACGLEARPDRQHARKDIIGKPTQVHVGRIPPELHLVLHLIAHFDVRIGPPLVLCNLSQQRQRTRPGHVDLLRVPAGPDEDGLGGRVVGQRPDGILHRREVGALVRGADEEGAFGTLRQWVFACQGLACGVS